MNESHNLSGLMSISEIPMNLGMISDEDDDIEGSEFNTADLLNSSAQDCVSNSLARSGTIPGISAAAAMVTTRRRNRSYKFELDPAMRRRQQTRLLRKLRQTIHELCTRCGQQAVVLCASPGKDNPSFKVFGSSPLDQAVRGCQSSILREFERDLQKKLSANNSSNSNGELSSVLPYLMVDGIPTTIDKMNQAQLRMFIPEMLKYSTGRGKPGWGKDSTRPIWWPLDVPWANIRRDDRSEDMKVKVSWTTALRQIVKNCYRYHDREDLLLGMPCEQSTQTNSAEVNHPHRLKLSGANSPLTFSPPTLVQTVHNSDGSVSLVQLDSGQTIATITQDQSGAAVATLTNHHSTSGGNHDELIGAMESGEWTLTHENTDMEAAFDVIAAEEGSSMQQANNISGKTVTQQHHQQQQLSLTFENDAQIISDENMALTQPGSHSVEIPVSVYEKIAHSIQQTTQHAGDNGRQQPTVAIAPDGRLHVHRARDHTSSGGCGPEILKGDVKPS